MNRTGSPSALIDHLCIVERAGDGATFVKRLKRGYTKGCFNLISTNADMIEDVELAWAARVRDMRAPNAKEGSEAA